MQQTETDKKEPARGGLKGYNMLNMFTIIKLTQRYRGVNLKKTPH